MTAGFKKCRLFVRFPLLYKHLSDRDGIPKGGKLGLLLSGEAFIKQKHANSFPILFLT